jgi:hypothetical protein
MLRFRGSEVIYPDLHAAAMRPFADVIAVALHVASNVKTSLTAEWCGLVPDYASDNLRLHHHGN